jgi:protocatechuate 3,4-dioxygenase beta subunit
MTESRRRLGWLIAFAVAIWVAVVRVAGGTAPVASSPVNGIAPARRDVAHAAPRVPQLEAPAPEVAAEDLDALRLEGQVIDAEDQPVAGARVTVGDRVAITEADGAFAFDGLAAGHYHVTAEQGAGFAEAPSFELDATSDPVTLKLAVGPTLIVRVVDEHGAALAGARVVVAGRTLVTPADGVVRFRGVATDDETVDVRAMHRGRVHRKVATTPEMREVECTVALGPGSQVSGTVVDERGAPVREAWVELTSEDGGDLLNTDADGTFHFDDLGDGSYELSASSKTHVATGKLAIAHSGARDTAGLVVRVERGAEIAGVVVDAAGRPVAEADVSGGNTTVHSDGDGRFVLTGLEPHVYELSATTATTGSPIERVLVERGGRGTARLVVTPSSLAGVVVDPRGQPISQAFVVAQADGPDGPRILVERADLYGHFDFGGVPPSRYDVYAQRGLDDPEGAKRSVTPTARTLRLVAPDRP